jgi:hypothetical protein
MQTVVNELRLFFSRYEKLFMQSLKETPDVESVAGVFADYFVEASPVGVIGGKNDASFRERIPKGYEFYKSIGTTSMQITALESTALNELHYMTRVQWRAGYHKKDGSRENIDFEVIYFTQHIKSEIKIFAYITGDEQKVLRERGLIQ